MPAGRRLKNEVKRNEKFSAFPHFRISAFPHFRISASLLFLVMTFALFFSLVFSCADPEEVAQIGDWTDFDIMSFNQEYEGLMESYVENGFAEKLNAVDEDGNELTRSEEDTSEVSEEEDSALVFASTEALNSFWSDLDVLLGKYGIVDDENVDNDIDWFEEIGDYETRAASIPVNRITSAMIDTAYQKGARRKCKFVGYNSSLKKKYACAYYAEGYLPQPLPIPDEHTVQLMIDRHTQSKKIRYESRSISANPVVITVAGKRGGYARFEHKWYANGVVNNRPSGRVIKSFTRKVGF